MGVTKVKHPKKGPAPLTRVTWGAFSPGSLGRSSGSCTPMDSKPARRAGWCDERCQIWLLGGVLGFSPCGVCNSPPLPAFPGGLFPLKSFCWEPSPCLNGHHTFNPNNQVTPAQSQWQQASVNDYPGPFGLCKPACAVPRALGSDKPSPSERNTKDLPTHIESCLEPAGIFLLPF